MKRVFALVLILGLGTFMLRAQRELDPFDQNVTTGPEVGERIPDFQAPDQFGNQRDLDSVSGPDGAMVFLYRSADW